MAFVFDAIDDITYSQDRLSSIARANVIDRWIYVFTAACFIAIVLTGFVPASFDKIAAVRGGTRSAFPPILHVHAVLMGSFLVLLLGQAVLVAIDKRGLHMRLGIAAAVLVPAIVISGIILALTTYRSDWNAAQMALPPLRQQLQGVLPRLDNLLLLQLRTGFAFSLSVGIALMSRTRDSGVHKRLMFLAVAAALPAAFGRMRWLPTTMPNHPLAVDFYTVLAFSPMLIWDLVRDKYLHRAYLIWAAFFLPVTVAVYALWDTPWWHATAHHIMGV
jgi:hypothetical protein